MVQQEELEAELAHSVAQIAPEVVGNEYMVLGTIEKKVWQARLSGKGQPLGDMLKHVADFKKEYRLEYEPGGRYPADHEPRKQVRPARARKV